MRLSELKIHEMLGSGGGGEIYRATVQSGSSGSRDYAFKKLINASSSEEDNIRVLVNFRLKLAAVELAQIDESTTWPLEVVEDQGVFTGFLMELIPSRYIESNLSLVTGSASEVRCIDWLADPTNARTVGVKVVVEKSDIVKRLVVCARIARLFDLFDRHSITYGDLSLRNVLYADEPMDALLIDVDPCRIDRLSPAFAQKNTLGMRAPEQKTNGNQQDRYTDRFKMAMIFYSILASTIQVSDLKAIKSVLDPAGVDLFRRALSSVPTGRPSPNEWYSYMHGSVMALIRPPLVHFFSASNSVVFSGNPIRLSWNATGFTELWLIEPDGTRLRLSNAQSDSVERTPVASCRYTLLLENNYFSVEVQSELVTVIAAPTISEISVPTFGHLDKVVSGLTDRERASLASALSVEPGYQAIVHAGPELGSSWLEVDSHEMNPDLTEVHRSLLDTGVGLSAVLEQGGLLFESALMAGTREINRRRSILRWLSRHRW